MDNFKDGKTDRQTSTKKAGIMYIYIYIYLFMYLFIHVATYFLVCFVRAHTLETKTLVDPHK